MFVPRGVRQIEGVASEEDLRGGMGVDQTREIGADVRTGVGTQVRVTDDEERTNVRRHGANTDDRSDARGRPPHERDVSRT